MKYEPLTNGGCMSGNFFVHIRTLTSAIVIFAGGYAASAQDLIAVLDVVSDGTVPANYCTIISDTISAIVARDTTYMQFDRAMIPDLLGQLTVKEAATACSDPQCLVLIGNLIGANLVIGGFIRYNNNLTEIELNLVSIEERRALNTVSISTGSKKSVILTSEIPALVSSLLNPDVPLPPTKLVAEKKNFFTTPWPYAATLFAGAAGAGAYYYQYIYKPNRDGKPDNPDKPDIATETPSLYGDFPVREE